MNFSRFNSNLFRLKILKKNLSHATMEDDMAAYSSGNICRRHVAHACVYVCAYD